MALTPLIPEKVSALTAASAITGTETVYIVQGGNSRKTTVAELVTAFGSMAAQNANNVAVTGGKLTGITNIQIGITDPDVTRGLFAYKNSASEIPIFARNDAVGGIIQQWNNASGQLGKFSTDGVFEVSPAPVGVNSPGLAVLTNGSGSSYAMFLVNSGVGGSPFVLANTTESDFPAMNFYRGGVNVGKIQCSAGTTAYVTSSDYRLKPIVETLIDFTLTEDQFAALPDPLLRVMSLRPVRHNWIDAPDTWLHGFIAHEAQPIVPHAVTGEKDAVEDYGTATSPQEIIPRHVNADGEEVPETVAPKRIRPDIAESDTPPGWSWEKVGTRIIPQGMDHAKIVADLTAAIQSLTLIVLEQQDRIAALEAQ
jgi:hypothetical protein